MQQKTLTPESMSPTILKPGKHSGQFRTRSHASLSTFASEEIRRVTQNAGFYSSEGWLRAVEKTWREPAAYVSCSDEAGRCVGILPVYQPRAGAYDLRAIISRPDAPLSPPDAICIGSQAGYSTEFLIDPTLPVETQDQVLRTMIEYAQSLFHDAEIAILHLNPRGQEQLLRAGLDPERLFITGINCRLDLAFDSVEEYSRSMGQKRGVAIRREFNTFANSGLDVSISPLEANLDDAARLCTALQKKYGDDSTGIDQRRSYFELLSGCTPGESVVFKATRDGRAIGLTIAFVRDEVLYMRQAGFDYEVGGRAFEYFNLAYYEPIKFALSNGLTKIDLGPGSYQAKLSRGAQPETLRGWASSVNSNDVDLSAFWSRQNLIDELLQSPHGRELDAVDAL